MFKANRKPLVNGEKFGRLTIVAKQAGKSADGRTLYLCKCECGNTLLVPANRLKNGNTKSCGCLKRDKGIEANTTHGLSKTRLYRIWGSMIDRCERKGCERYSRYGGRGITVCKEWRNNFQAFYDWAMANGYNPNAKFGECTIDRINTDGNYEPSNCKWVTNKEQANNKECTCRLEHNGECHTLKEWATITGISYNTIHKRFRRGETPSAILHIGRLPKNSKAVNTDGILLQ